MELNILSLTASDSNKTITVDESVFMRDFNEPLVHQVVTGYLANARSGTRAQKSRGLIAKSTRKPWKQKGTGRARAGMASSPLWRGGGRIFPNLPDENFSQKINKKMYRIAISSILSELIRKAQLKVIDKLIVAKPKTKEFVAILKNLSLENKTNLFVVLNIDDDIFLAARNLQNVLIVDVKNVNPHSLLCFNNVIFESLAIEKLQEQIK